MRKLLTGLGGAWVTLGVATLLKTAAAFWLAWWTLAVAAWSRSTYRFESLPLPDGAYDALVVMVTFSTLAAVFALIVTVGQSIWLRPVPRGWIARSVAAAAITAGALGGLFTIYNHTVGFPGITFAVAQFVICALAECAAMFAAQRKVVLGLAGA
jgi:hypothetical protein